MDLTDISKKSDEALAVHFTNGSEEAFEHLYKRYKDKLMGYLVSKVRKIEIAEEVYQLTWSKVVNSIHLFDSSKKFSTWLFTISTNTFKDWVKSNSNHLKLLENLSVNADIENQTISNNYAELNLDFLDKVQKEVILLKYTRGFKSKEIAEKLNLTDSNIRKIISRAKLSIKQYLINGGQL